MPNRWLFPSLVLSIVIAGLAPVLTRSPGSALSKADWQEDLKYFAKELPKRHRNLYHATSREQFDRAVRDLDAAIPALADHQVIVRLARIAATVGDGHTRVQLPASFRLYPLALYWFGPELRVIAAGKEYESVRGARVVKIGDTSIDEVQARVRSEEHTSELQSL